MSRREVEYITSGQRWAWGWHRYEAKTMLVLLAIILASILLGLLVGIWVGITQEWSWLLVLLVVLGVTLLAAAVGLGVAKAIVGPLWAFLTTQEGE